MARVTYATMFTVSRDNVVSLITDNVSDPISSSAQSRKWIYSRMPDVKASSFSGYPFIIINCMDVSDDDNFGSGTGKSLDMKSEMPVFTIEVEVVASDRGYGDSDAKAMAHIDAISNSIRSIFKSKTNRQTLRAASLSFATMDSSITVPVTIANELAYSRTFTIGFKTKMQVSA